MQWAFEDCIGLTSITIPASVTDIAPSAFDDCISLTSIKIAGVEVTWRDIHNGTWKDVVNRK